jgi:hypothetical protein
MYMHISVKQTARGPTSIAAAHVYGLHEIPVRISHLSKGDVAQNTSVVDDDVDTAVCFDGGINNLGAIGHRVAVGDRYATSSGDLPYNGFGGRRATCTNISK